MTGYMEQVKFIGNITAITGVVKKIMKENHLSKKNDEANEFGSKPWETVTVENHGNGCFW